MAHVVKCTNGVIMDKVICFDRRGVSDAALLTFLHFILFFKFVCAVCLKFVTKRWIFCDLLLDPSDVSLFFFSGL